MDNNEHLMGIIGIAAAAMALTGALAPTDVLLFAVGGYFAARQVKAI